MPKRSFENVEEFEEHITGAEEIIIDGTENSTAIPALDHILLANSTL
jgi:hypothetical protein